MKKTKRSPHFRVTPTTKTSRIDWWFIFILILSFWFRVGFVGVIEFKTDEAISLFQTVLFYQNPHLIQTGIYTSTGVTNLPLFQYLLILLSLPSREPTVVSAMIGLANTVAIAGFYLTVKKFYGRKAAIVAALLLAVSPRAILYSRKIWAQDLMLLLAVPVFYLWNWARTTRVGVWFWVVWTSSLLWIAQLHLAGVALLLILSGWTIYNKLRPSWKGVGCGLILGLLPALPYIYFQITHSWPDLAVLSQYHNQSAAPWWLHSWRLLQPLSFGGYAWDLGGAYPDFVRSLGWGVDVETVAAILVAGMVFFVWKARGYTEIKSLIVIPVGVAVIQILLRTIPHPHYYLSLYPWIFTAVGVAWVKFESRTKIRFSWGKLVLILVVGVNCWFQWRLFKFLATKSTYPNDLFGPTWEQTQSKVLTATSRYQEADYYQTLIYYSYIYATSDNLPVDIAEFFMQRGLIDLAIDELSIGLRNNPKDPKALAHTAVLYGENGTDYLSKLNQLVGADQAEALVAESRVLIGQFKD